MNRCYLCDCKLKHNIEQCECCDHEFCFNCWDRIQYVIINMPFELQEEYLTNGPNFMYCPCSLDSGRTCLSSRQMDYVLSSV